MVANLMKNEAKFLNLDENEMFLLGFLHDIGYEIDANNHEIAGGNFLKSQKYICQRSVLSWHAKLRIFVPCT